MPVEAELLQCKIPWYHRCTSSNPGRWEINKRTAKFYSSPITIHPDFCSSRQRGQCFALIVAAIRSSSTEDTRSDWIIFSKSMQIITFSHFEDADFLWLVLNINFFENSRVVYYKANRTASTMWFTSLLISY